MSPKLPEGFKASFRKPFTPSPDPELREEVRGFNTTQREGLRDQARKDRYFLARGVLGYRDVNPYSHGPMCRALEDRTQNRRMYLAPRGHLKSTLNTITDSIGLSLEAPDEARILILNEIEENSVGFLAEIKGHWENGEILRELFPELVPERTVGAGSRWSATRACLPRSTNYKEWTYSAIGLGGAVTSRHYTHIKGDDMIGLEARESPAAMKRAINYAKTLEPLLVDMDENFIDFIGTRWTLLDLYHEMLRVYLPDMLYFSREDIEVVPPLALEMLREAGFGYAGRKKPPLSDEEVLAKVGTMQPIFPRKFSLKRLNQLATIDPELYYAQYKNSPIAAGIRDFSADRIQYFDFDNDGNVVWRDDRGAIRRWRRDLLDIVMTVDPNGGELASPDYPAIMVCAYSPLNQVFVFDSDARRCQPDVFVDRIYEIWQRWHPRVLGIEKAGQQTTAFYFKKKAKELQVYINQVEVKPGNRNKEVKIRKAVQPIVNQGRLYLRKHMATLKRQIEFFPGVENDDEIECLAYATELFRTPQTQKEMDEAEEAVQTVLRRRNATTGY